MTSPGPAEGLNEFAARLGTQLREDHAQGRESLLEDYLASAPHLAVTEERLLSLIRVEHEVRRECGRPASIANYQVRFPSVANRIEEALSEGAPVSRPDGLPTTWVAEPYSQKASPATHGFPAAPACIGRYQIEQTLGAGAFGVVYLAHDPTLDRRVAIKVPHASRFQSEGDKRRVLSEARTAGRLHHDGIVAVHDVVEFDGRLGIVQEYVDGVDLRAWLKRRATPLSAREAAELVAAIAETLEVAHQHRLVHRDLKPDNVLIDGAGIPKIADFGLALDERMRKKATGEIAGTPDYMSPEQVRGESNRIDGRSDIWALGVMLYELLTERRPFQAESRAALFAAIEQDEPASPRRFSPEIPEELARICLKCLSKRMADRYDFALGLAADLRTWMGEAEGDKRPSTAAPLVVSPKGLRAFDESDAEAYLELLPGPRGPDRLPVSVQFWRARLSARFAPFAFPVGLLYGPSGCGKSSFVKAALLPRLTARTTAIHLEADAHNTLSRLLAAVRERWPDLNASLTLAEAIGALREDRLPPGEKVVIVIDQFEQWLHANPEASAASDLIAALRQCDGARVQALLMVRDDFWMAATRVFRQLETPLVEGHNTAAIDLLDRAQARKTLTAFGRAHGQLPNSDRELSTDQERFLDQAVEGLANRDRVVCVQLALFAELMKSRPWSTAALRDMGGAQGIGRTFLEETFSGPSSRPLARQHESAARAVLAALLPTGDDDIKGQRRTVKELQQAAKYDHRPDDFRDLIQLLDGELRLVTPAGPIDAEPAPSKSYQLTHDYLVPTLRDWLHYKQRQTRRGRAELLLAERAALWAVKPIQRSLPSFLESVSIAWRTSRKRWTSAERRMMRQAAGVYGLRVGAALALVAAASVVAGFAVNAARETRANTLVKTVLAAPAEGLPFAIDNLRPLDTWAIPHLRTALADEKADESQRLHAACALAELDDVDAEQLVGFVAAAAPNECPNLVRAIGRNKAAGLPQLKIHGSRASLAGLWEWKARLAIVALALGDDTLAAAMLKIEGKTDPIERTIFIDTLPRWHGDLAALAEMMEESPRGEVRSGVALGIGGVADMDARAKAAWRPILAKWYSEQPDAVTHGAAGWLMRTWKLPMPASTSPPADSNWMVTPVGLTLIRLAPGEFMRWNDTRHQARHQVTLRRPVWIADRETSVALFEQFVLDESYPGDKPSSATKRTIKQSIEQEAVSSQAVTYVSERVSPTPAHPMQQVSWYEAVAFCNWLSWKEKRPPGYVPSGQMETFGSFGSHPGWRINSRGGGYRLPTEAEWEYAYRAGTMTEFACGGDPSRLEAYEVIKAATAEPAGSRRCNGWGIFDLGGNVAEWCHDWYVNFGADNLIDPLGPASGEQKAVRGGSMRLPAGGAAAEYRELYGAPYYTWYIGFRVLLTEN